MMEDLSKDFMQEGAKNERERILELIEDIFPNNNENVWDFKEELKKRITG